MTQAQERFEAAKNTIKKEVEEKKGKAASALAEVKNQLAAIQQDDVLSTLYMENARVGADNLGGESPLLKVHAAGRSSSNELFDGTEPHDGWFFYKPTSEQYREIDCHVLTISKGFKSAGLEEGKKDVFNQILGGVIIDGTDYKPFIMYFTGLKLSNLWEFGKQARKYTRAKPMPMPMFSLTTRLTTEKKENNYGKSWVVNFEIVKNEDGTPKLVMDPGEFQFLKDTAQGLEEQIDALIEAKAVKETETVMATPIQVTKVVHQEDNFDDEIPF